MRTVRLALLAVLALLAAGCANPARVVAPDPVDTVVAVGTAHISEANVQVFFYPTDDKYTHVVQEVHTSRGSLVESFRQDGYIRDQHTWPKTRQKEVRRMYVYAANVEGADESNSGFAHLPDNGEGVETTLGENFNSWYHEKYETRGRITKKSPHRTTWTISADGEWIEVVTHNALRVRVKESE